MSLAFYWATRFAHSFPLDGELGRGEAGTTSISSSSSRSSYLISAMRSTSGFEEGDLAVQTEATPRCLNQYPEACYHRQTVFSAKGLRRILLIREAVHRKRRLSGARVSKYAHAEDLRVLAHWKLHAGALAGLDFLSFGPTIEGKSRKARSLRRCSAQSASPETLSGNCKRVHASEAFRGRSL